MKGIATLVGIALVAGHGWAFVHFSERARGADLSVETSSPLASDVLALDGKVPDKLAPRIVRDGSEAGEGAGLRHVRWSTTYRGGFTRSVGATQLVGPFQDPDREQCSGRVIVGQKMLDGGPSSIATAMKAMIEAEMKLVEIWGAGDFEGVENVSLIWAQAAKHPDDKGMLPAGTDGYVRVGVRLAFGRVDIPLVVALIPRIEKGSLHFKVVTRAVLDFDNRVLQWASDKIGGDTFATKLAGREIDAALITTLAPPPPFDLPDKQRLEFLYCDKPPEIVEGSHAALPFAVSIGRVDGAKHVLPPTLGAAPHADVPKDTMVAMDLDLDALNALLYELWRSGFLDRRLAEVGLDRSFNTDPIVTEYLSIRISPVRLALPPVITADAKGLQLAADGRVAISDGKQTTVGRVWGGLSLTFTGAAGKQLGTSVDLRALELSCEQSNRPDRVTLVPCYADLVGAIKDRTDQFHGVLTDAFAKLVTDIFVEQRVGASGMPVDLVIHDVRPSLSAAAPNASMRLTFDASLSPAK